MNEAKLLTFSFLTAQNMPFSSEWFARKSKHLKGHSAFYVSNVMFCQKSFKFVPPPKKKKSLEYGRNAHSSIELDWPKKGV